MPPSYSIILEAVTAGATIFLAGATYWLARKTATLVRFTAQDHRIRTQPQVVLDWSVAAFAGADDIMVISATLRETAGVPVVIDSIHIGSKIRSGKPLTMADLFPPEPDQDSLLGAQPHVFGTSHYPVFWDPMPAPPLPPDSNSLGQVVISYAFFVEADPNRCESWKAYATLYVKPDADGTVVIRSSDPSCSYRTPGDDSSNAIRRAWRNWRDWKDQMGL